MCRERVRACAGGSVAGMGEAVRESGVELVHSSRSLHSMHFAVNVEDECRGSSKSGALRVVQVLRGIRIRTVSEKADQRPALGFV